MMAECPGKASILGPGSKARAIGGRVGHNRRGGGGGGRQLERATTELEHFRAMLQAYMDRKGLRSTDQRKLIVETFFRAENHVSIAELIAQVREKDRRVG